MCDDWTYDYGVEEGIARSWCSACDKVILATDDCWSRIVSVGEYNEVVLLCLECGSDYGLER